MPCLALPPSHCISPFYFYLIFVGQGSRFPQRRLTLVCVWSCLRPLPLSPDPLRSLSVGLRVGLRVSLRVGLR